MIINYQSDIRMKELKNKFENEIAATINDVKKFLQKEYKAITGNSVTLQRKVNVEFLFNKHQMFEHLSKPTNTIR
jgi:NADH:ubiquinone oxidoreductase subunit D